MNTSTLTLPNGSNIMLVPMNQPSTNLAQPAARNKHIQLCSKSLLALSIINIILWTISTFLQVSTLVAFSTGLFNFYHWSWDVGGWGIWCSLFYAISGFTGYSASYNKKRSLIITSLVFAVFSLASSTVAVTFATMQAIQTGYYSCYYYSNGDYIYVWYECYLWSALEWTLMSISVLAFTINIAVIVITSKAVCECCRCKKSDSPQVVVATAPNTTMQYSMPYATSLSPNGIQQPIFSPLTPQQQNYAIVNQQAYPLQQQLLQQQQPEGLLQFPSVPQTNVANTLENKSITVPVIVETA